MLSIDCVTHKFASPEKDNRLIAAAETTKIITYRKNPRGIIGTDLQQCCQQGQGQKSISPVFIEETNRLLNHVFTCSGCTLSSCQRFKASLYHSLLCCEEGTWFFS